jgi:sugar/nucleoside kinase (ribokinase family)
MKKVLGIGNALTDILIRIENDNFLTEFSLPKGSMQLIDANLSTRILAKAEGMERSLVSGGSAANTINGLAALGIDTGFIGKIGKDNWGEFFEDDMKKHGIKPKLFKSNTESGRCVALISNDSERTMATYLGAAVELTANDIAPDIYDGYDIFHIEGYLVQNKELIETALKIAKDKGLTVSLDLASYNVVEENREFLLDMTKKYVDILFANEEEAKAFSKEQDYHKALDFMSNYCNISILKKGAGGSMISCNGDKTNIDIKPVKSIDTTGAGDLYASGFLYGYINSLSIEKCGQIGSLVAANVIQVIGTKLTEQQWFNINPLIFS